MCDCNISYVDACKQPLPQLPVTKWLGHFWPSAGHASWGPKMHAGALGYPRIIPWRTPKKITSWQVKSIYIYSIKNIQKWLSQKTHLKKLRHADSQKRNARSPAGSVNTPWDSPWDALPRDGARAPSITSRNCLPRISSCPAPEKIRGRLNHEIPNDDPSPIIEWFVFMLSSCVFYLINPQLEWFEWFVSLRMMSYLTTLTWDDLSQSVDKWISGTGWYVWVWGPP